VVENGQYYLGFVHFLARVRQMYKVEVMLDFASLSIFVPKMYKAEIMKKKEFANLLQQTGVPKPLGVSFHAEKINFAVFASHAHRVDLCLFLTDSPSHDIEIPMNGPINGTWHVELIGCPINASYAYRVHDADHEFLLSDPYARNFTHVYQWGDFSEERIFALCPIQPPEPFDWQGTEHPCLPKKDLIIYEMHVRGFTMHSSSKAHSPGSYAGVIEKIGYLKKLGVNAIELMPVYAFDETFSPKVYSSIQLPRINYWGYNPISFFIPMQQYAYCPANAINEFKTMVRELHRAGIEVILDVVYNHTGERLEQPVACRGLDEKEYFIIDAQGNDSNYSGCGNTFSCNSPAGKNLILDSLHYWVNEMKVDGFRFDLASILTRGPNGHPMDDPSLMEAIANDPVLKNVKLIAEPWDAVGLNLTGQFHRWGCWSEWNGSFRDHVRSFIKGTENEIGFFAASLCGNQSIYSPGTPQSSINFITAHDGFCLRDLVSYQNKRNIDNGENNRDGADHNLSWNCGAEGPTQDEHIHELREQQLRNFWMALLLAQGIPMILMGDEVGHTRKGNNNPYVQDNEVNWFDWHVLEHNRPMFGFVSSLIAFRKRHPLLTKTKFLQENDIEWHGHQPHKPDWRPSSRFIAYTLKGQHPLYVAFNADHHPATIELPRLVHQKWKILVDTHKPWSQHYLDQPGMAPSAEHSMTMAPYSSLLYKAD
jgi:isoamylase